jgi:hypothetical protein
MGIAQKAQKHLRSTAEILTSRQISAWKKNEGIVTHSPAYDAARTTDNVR